MMKTSNTFTVTDFPRLHMGLHDCGYATDRIFGGVGVSFEGFPTTVRARKATKTKIDFTAENTPSERTIETTHNLLSRLTPLLGNFSIELTSLAPEHKGFGSKTSLLLAITRAAILASGKQTGISREEIIKFTERGGTSGIGVNTFWTGGLIADGGHYAPEKPRYFAPSSARGAHSVAPVVARVAMHDNWRVQLFHDPEAMPIEGTKEVELFSKLMPLPDVENFNSLAATYHGIIPAVREANLDRLAIAVRKLNSAGMKASEVELQTAKTKDFLHKSWEEGIAAGLTSFGPTVYVINHMDTDPLEKVDRLAASSGLLPLGIFPFNNHGAIIQEI